MQTEIESMPTERPKNITDALVNLELWCSSNKSLKTVYNKVHLFIQSKEPIHLKYMLDMLEKSIKGNKETKEKMVAMGSEYLRIIIMGW